jgi:hypothetical protein
MDEVFSDDGSLDAPGGPSHRARPPQARTMLIGKSFAGMMQIKSGRMPS